MFHGNARKLPTHVSQFVLFSRAIVSEVISSTSSRENPSIFCKVTASTVKQQNTRNLFCEVTRKNTRNLYTRFGSCIFSCYKRVSSQGLSSLQEKSSISRENHKNCFRGGVRSMTHFLEKDASYAKNKYNPFHSELDAEYFFIKLLFSKKQNFPEKSRKTIFGAHDYF